MAVLCVKFSKPRHYTILCVSVKLYMCGVIAGHILEPMAGYRGRVPAELSRFSHFRP